ncbi:RNA polymerase sigma-70 factor, ECF subfamily [Rubritalea squalenifaciens DSM 18772]|uniref:RNA polymerase sigma-70 factor, ECF subfamily n=1 Tax=Rubritalea squalenifaciens DSM 18772 TaxID=1123071 RepID=A0A1M6SRS7_9BACT|nr:sigma-70 family RNA polymerase sigma factor [Rubritalea squalenifaciens]SHK47366.1 RNA polymerase sigma-70 factor, ECF subfamily [Rubritalea squalenifaciens DSM 18772]
MKNRPHSSLHTSAEFVCLLTEHQSALWAYIITLMPGSPDVADVLQKTNLVLWTKQEEFSLGTNFKAWAFQIARFQVLAHLKKNKRLSWMVFEEDLLDTVAEESGAALDASTGKLSYLDSCMQQLSAEDQQLLRYRYQSESNLAEYAAKSGRSVSSLSVTLHRLRVALRNCINRKIEEEGRLA